MKQILAQWEAEKSLLVEGKIQNKGARVGLWKLKNSCSKNWNPFPNFCCGGTGKLFAFFFFLFFFVRKVGSTVSFRLAWGENQTWLEPHPHLLGVPLPTFFLRDEKLLRDEYQIFQRPHQPGQSSLLCARIPCHCLPVACMSKADLLFNLPAQLLRYCLPNRKEIAGRETADTKGTSSKVWHPTWLLRQQ